MCFAFASARQSMVVALRFPCVRRRAFSLVGIWLRQFVKWFPEQIHRRVWGVGAPQVKTGGLGGKTSREDNLLLFLVGHIRPGASAPLGCLGFWSCSVAFRLCFPPSGFILESVFLSAAPPNLFAVKKHRSSYNKIPVATAPDATAAAASEPTAGPVAAQVATTLRGLTRRARFRVASAT